VKESSIKCSLGTLTLLGLVAIAAAPASATNSDRIGERAPQSTPLQTQSSAPPSRDLPFFARFLEGQQPAATASQVALTGGGIQIAPKLPDNTDNNNVQTRKYPSDSEDNTGGGIVTTQKYPSDSEDNTGGGIVTKIDERSNHYSHSGQSKY
jgi:hypothetical protein